MKAELYMISPEQEFSARTVQGATGVGADVSPEPALREPWFRLWERDWIRLWERDWLRLWERSWYRTWCRGWYRFWDRGWENWGPPWELDRILQGESPGKIEPIMERLLLRREEDGFLAMDGLTSRILKLDEQAGKLVQLVQDGMSPEEAAEQVGAKKKELEEFIAFLDLHDVSPER
jgi:hypothetical protein